MLSRWLGLGAQHTHWDQEVRYCYVKPAVIEQLLQTPGVIELLAEQLGAELTREQDARGLPVEQLARIRRRAIHLAVSADSPFFGLSVEEIVVLSVYASERFDYTVWKRELKRQPSQQELARLCEHWLKERAGAAFVTKQAGPAQVQLVGRMAADPASPSPFVASVAVYTDALALQGALEGTRAGGPFAHEQYMACTPATALEYLRLQAVSAPSLSWDPCALDRSLRNHGFGLLLVENERIHQCLMARYSVAPGATTSQGWVR